MLRNRTNPDKLNWEVVIFMALYTIMPTYCAIEFHDTIPLITISRILLMVMGVVFIIRQRKDLFHLRQFSLRKLNLGLTDDKFLRWGLLLYWLILLIVNVTFLFDTSEAIKQIFVMTAEEYILVWLLTAVLNTRKKLISAIKIFVFASGITGVIAAISCILDFNPFHLLDTVSRELTQATYYRMGMLRAAAGFGHPVYYGAFCAVMTPLCMYLIDICSSKYERRMYCVCMALNIAGVLLSNSRGSLLALGCTALVIFLYHIKTKSIKALFIRYLPVIVIALIIIILVVILCPVGRAYISNLFTFLTVDNPSNIPGVVGPEAPSDSPLRPTLPDISFGENRRGATSRKVQLTGITYTLRQKPLFGMGPNAFARGLVAYTYVEGHLSFIKTVDVNLVAIIGQYGLVGLLAFLSQFVSVGITTIRKKYRSDVLMHHLFLSFGCYMVCLLTISNLDKWYWVFVGFLVCLVNILRHETAQTTQGE